MANIVITEKCNLNCSYCFANDIVNKEIKEISQEDFIKAIEFIKGEKKDCTVGIIGGEPLLHPNFDGLMEILCQDDNITNVHIFTNGILIDKYIDQLQDSKFSFLINVNNPEVIGKTNYERIRKNIALLKTAFNKSDRITLGLNIYGIDLDYSYYLNLIDEFGFKHARISIVVEKNNVNALSRFQKYNQTVFNLIKELWKRKILFRFDCNYPPNCAWDKTQQLKIELIQQNLESWGVNLDRACCKPVIDILPDLYAIRCFGLSKSSRVRIKDFSTITQLYDYYVQEFDSKVFESCPYELCQTCDQFLNKKCHAGCLSNRF